MINNTTVWQIEGSGPVAGSRATLYYNSEAGPLRGKPKVVCRLGYNSWQGARDLEMKPDSKRPGMFKCLVDVPLEAVALNFVFSDGGSTYDNNGKQDFRAAVLPPARVNGSVDTWIGEMLEVFRKKEEHLRTETEAREEQKAALRDENRRKARQQALEVLRRQMRHVLFTEPAELEAGQECIIHYNPTDTPLRGRDRIFVRAGFNRWTHGRRIGPIEMTRPVEGGSHFTATVKIPRDAYKLDFVFSDTDGEVGTFDNRGGYDYHLPVSCVVREPPLHIMHVAVEMAPIAKVGGLGDVVTSLGRAIAEDGHSVEVVLPRFRFFDSSPVLKDQWKFETEFDWGGTRIVVVSAIVEGLKCFFVEARNGFFDTQTVYGRSDDGMRFDFFCKASAGGQAPRLPSLHALIADALPHRLPSSS